MPVALAGAGLALAERKPAIAAAPRESRRAAVQASAKASKFIRYQKEMDKEDGERSSVEDSAESQFEDDDFV